MKTLYIECKMGVAGDMLAASLIEHVNEEEFVAKMNSLNIPGVSFEIERIKRCGITGNKVHVVIDGVEEGEHSHGDVAHGTSLDGISVHINGLDLPKKVKTDALSVYNLLAEAESEVHKTNIKDISQK